MINHYCILIHECDFSLTRLIIPSDFLVVHFPFFKNFITVFPAYLAFVF
jgi:hypothetical protein